MESMEGLECYVIEMKFKGYGEDEPLFKPMFFQTFRGQDVHNGQIVTGDITQAYRFNSAHSAAGTARLLLHNPTVSNSTLKSYEISIRKMQFVRHQRVRLADDGHSILFYD